MSSEALAFLIIFVLLGCAMFVLAAVAAMRFASAQRGDERVDESWSHDDDRGLRAGDKLPVEDNAVTYLREAMAAAFPVLGLGYESDDDPWKSNIPSPDCLYDRYGVCNVFVPKAQTQRSYEAPTRVDDFPKESYSDYMVNPTRKPNTIRKHLTSISERRTARAKRANKVRQSKEKQEKQKKS